MYDRKTLVEVFKIAAQQHGARVAAKFESKSVTYKELDTLSDVMCATIITKVGSKPSRIGISCEKNIDFIIAIIAVMKAGAAYVPIDPALPEARKQYIVKESELQCIITNEDGDSLATGSMIAIKANAYKSAEVGWANLEVAPPLPEDVAYIIFTSGSTGRPKGVKVSHANVLSLFRSTSTLFSVDEHDVWTLFHPLSFDFSVWELWGALLYGGTVVIVPREISLSPLDYYGLLIEEGVTILNETPAHFWQFADLIRDRDIVGKGCELGAGKSAIETPKSVSLSRMLNSTKLRLVIFGGEELNYSRFDKYYDKNCNFAQKFVNMYGITETTVHVTAKEFLITENTGQYGRSIGMPLANASIMILRDDGSEAKREEVGEICVIGDGVSLGYINDPAGMAEKFCELTDDRVIRRLYHSGDYGRMLSNGEYSYEGRRDGQVKIRGFRVDVLEIENAVLGLEGISGTMVTAVDDGNGGRTIVCFYSVDINSNLSDDDIIVALQSVLPEFAVPGILRRVKSIMVNENGKIDKEAMLSSLSQEGMRDANTDGIGEIIIAIVTDIFASCLGVDDIDIEASFFRLGGHSLLVAKTVYKIREIFDIRIPISVFFERPTVVGVANYILGQGDAAEKLSTIVKTYRTL